MSVETELEAIRTGAAIFPLTDRAFLRITGSDATRWLNGMVTNSIQSLQPGEGNYNFLLNAQGRIQGDCTIYREPNAEIPEYLLSTDASQLKTIHELLDKFIIMDDVELAEGTSVYPRYVPVGPPMTGISVIGSMAQQMLAKVVTDQNGEALTLLNTSSMTRGRANGNMLLIFSNRTATGHTYDFWFDNASEKDLVTSQLQALGAIKLSPEALEAHRILTTTPKYGIDIRNTETHKDLPQETAQTHALHFNKGCYLGQEIVERIRSRGQVHRSFTAFTLTGELPTLPAPLEAAIAGQTRPAGELTSAMRIGDTIHALGYLRREFANHPLTYPGGIAKPALSSHETLKPAP